MFNIAGQKLLAKIATEQQARSIPIFNGVANNQIEQVKQLIAANPDVVNTQAPGGNKTPLHIAVEKNYEKMVEILITAKAKVNVVTQNGITPLHVAAQIGNKKIIARLIQAGAPINASSNVGCTPLHEAAAAGHKDATRLLLESKADPTIKDTRFHLTAANLAHENGHQTIRDILINAMNYQQLFIQNINYILFDWGRKFPSTFNEYKFIDALARAILFTKETKENADEIFKKVEDALIKDPVYNQVKQTLAPMRQLLFSNMKKYNENKAKALKQSKEISSVLNKQGMNIAEKSELAVDLVLEYCDLPKPK